MKKIAKFLGLFILSVILLTGGYVGFRILRVEIPASWYKEIDPKHPDFNPYRFKFSDYNGCPALNDIMKDILYIGMPKSEVDKILIKSGGASCGIGNKSFPNFYYCRKPKTYKNWDGIAPNFSLIFSDDLKLLNASPCVSTPIFPDSVTLEDLKREYDLRLKEKKNGS